MDKVAIQLPASRSRASFFLREILYIIKDIFRENYLTRIPDFPVFNFYPVASTCARAHPDFPFYPRTGTQMISPAVGADAWGEIRLIQEELLKTLPLPVR
jgi:hypothetical protein